MERSTSTGSCQKTPGLHTRVMGWCMVHHEDQDICNNCEENLIFMTRRTCQSAWFWWGSMRIKSTAIVVVLNRGIYLESDLVCDEEGDTFF